MYIAQIVDVHCLPRQPVCHAIVLYIFGNQNFHLKKMML
jgi:hypothetical protein